MNSIGSRNQSIFYIEGTALKKDCVIGGLPYIELSLGCSCLNVELSTKGDEDLGAALFRNDENKTRNGNLLSLLFETKWVKFLYKFA